MTRIALRVLLVLALAFAGAPTPGYAEEEKAGSLADQMAKAMPETPDDGAMHKLHYGLEIVEGIEVGLAIAEIHVAGMLGLGLAVAGPIAGAAALWVAIGSAHADAINSIIADQMKSGFSRGVVLGADDRKADFVKSNFVKWSPDQNDVYPEHKTKFQHAYNQALIAGYAQGRSLLEHKSWRASFFEDLYSSMSVHPLTTYGDQDDWSERTWVDYYIDCAAAFRKEHLK